MPAQKHRASPANEREVLCSPPFPAWAAIMEHNAAAVGTWPVELRTLRDAARAEALEIALRFSASIGVDGSGRDDGLIAMTGHQPEIYHPGVWAKDFLLQRLCDETGATGIDLVVDTDVGAVSVRVPRMAPEVSVAEIVLQKADGRAYAYLPVPDTEARDAFRGAGLEALATLPSPAPGQYFASFCDALDASAGTAANAAALVTAARRRYERPAATRYLELPMSMQATGTAFRRFAASIISDARRFRDVMNAELHAYRARTGTRSVAQPFPDLGGEDGRVEVPFWSLSDNGRNALSVDDEGVLYTGGTAVTRIGGDPASTERALDRSGLVLGPKAVALTMFERLLVADLFIHGTGGGRYDRVTDAVIRSYFGVEPPGFAVASLTLRLPLDAIATTDEDVALVEQRLQRLEHNPDQLLASIALDTPEQQAEAERLAAHKSALVAAIADPTADRKAIGAEIRATNAAIGRMLEPLAESLRMEAARLHAARDASAVLSDRTYPLCLWDPREVMDAVR